jgi:hypothetical protein
MAPFDFHSPSNTDSAFLEAFGVRYRPSALFFALVARQVGAKSWVRLQDFEVAAAFHLGLLKGYCINACLPLQFFGFSFQERLPLSTVLWGP